MKPLPAPSGSLCQETAMGLDIYVPCGQPATYIVAYKDRKEGPYVMCAGCADHNVKNRGARLIRKGEPHKPIAVIEAPKTSRLRAASKTKVDPSDALSRIMAMVEVMRAAQNKLALAADEAEKASSEVKRIEMTALPLLLTELGIKDIGLPDGGRVVLTEELQVGISEANKNAAHDWLRKKGDGGIIKTKLGMEFDRGEDKDAARIVREIQKIAAGRPVVVNEAVHYQTLKAYIREQREKGVNIPEMLFGIHVFSKAKLTPPKGKK